MMKIFHAVFLGFLEEQEILLNNHPIKMDKLPDYN